MHGSIHTVPPLALANILLSTMHHKKWMYSLGGITVTLPCIGTSSYSLSHPHDVIVVHGNSLSHEQFSSDYVSVPVV